MSNDATEMPGSEPGMATHAKTASVQPASAALPSEEDVARALIAYFIDHTGFQTVDEDEKKTSVSASYGGIWVDLRVYPMARAVLALFAPILAEKERAPYSIGEPEVGWRSHGSFSPEEKAKLRPVAETLAMLDGNAFFGNEVSAGAEWYEQYLPEAHALYEGNGGDSGWAGEASFAKPDARALAAEAALEKAEGFDFGNGITVESRGDGRWAVNNCGCVLNSDGDWEHEPRPSSRDDDFISRTRFDRDEAFRRAAAIRAQGE